ncbi:SlyX family protein [Diaphorobacter ruginosibacter]|uniref:SlyX family protein n=1 Tax=Diaphorobacter ruginosibacter TaxID=1715720 RepID=A0A7G9RKC7_9BURK|nr:SlyX family protein [Diaphorobacter ruginosibacter]QNN56052.1 SlyX family protein [Diaphorobacter ruginosibacter]
MADTESRTEQRLSELEIKTSYAEDLLDQLNMTIYRQQQQIDDLRAVVVELRKQLPAAGQQGAAQGVVDERPPHY